MGENEWQAPGKQGTDGEGYDCATLELTGLQQELVQAVYRTGTPTVVVLINGRPLATRWIAQHIPAVIEAWIPARRGAPPSRTFYSETSIQAAIYRSPFPGM